MRKKIKSIVKFIGVLIAMTMINAVVWGCVHFFIYDCTDPSFVPDYFEPGEWVHSHDGLPLVAVAHVVHGHSMSEPDTIKKGWSVAELWHLWFAFVAFSLIASFLLARSLRFPRRQRSEQTETA